MNHRRAFRPLRGGTLIYQWEKRDSGTIGMAVTSDGADRWLLTCRHVLARADGTIIV